MSFDENFEKLGLEFLAPPTAVAVYRPAIVVGNQCFTSGHLPICADRSLMTGCLGKDADEKQGYNAARQCGIAILSTLKATLGSLDNIERLVKLMAFVQCTDDFHAQPAVVNGCSELMRDVFGTDAGVGARSAVGTNSLPLNVMVEIEAIFQIK